MSNLQDCKWEWLDDSITSFHLGAIRCTIMYGGDKYEYCQIIPKDYILMQDHAGYFWHTIAHMGCKLDRAIQMAAYDWYRRNSSMFA